MKKIKIECDICGKSKEYMPNDAYFLNIVKTFAIDIRLRLEWNSDSIHNEKLDHVCYDCIENMFRGVKIIDDILLKKIKQYKKELK